MRMWSLVFTWSLVFFFQPLRAQPPQLRFESLTVSEGLTDNHIQCLFQDRSGFLWIGTQNGLVRYDGRYCQPFRAHAGPDSLSGHVVSAIIEDKRGVIWVGTLGGGLTRLDMNQPEGKRSRHFPRLPGIKNGLPTTRIHALYLFNDTTLLIGAEGVPVLFLNTRTLAFSCWTGKYPIHPSESKSEYSGKPDWCHAILPIGNGELWLSFLYNQRNLILDAATGRYLRMGVKHQPPLVTYAVIQTVGESLVAGGWSKGLIVGKRETTAQSRKIDLPDEAVALVPWGKGQVLAGTRNSGLFWVDLTTGAAKAYSYHRFDPATVISDNITCLFLDRENALWVGTEQGLSVYRPWAWRFQSWNLFPSTQENQPQLSGYEVFETPDGTVRICTSGGIFRKNAGSDGFQQLEFSFQGKKILPVGLFDTPSFGTVLGTESGFFHYNLEQDRLSPFELLSTVKGQKDGFFPLYDLFQVRSVVEDTFEGNPALVVGALGWGITVFDYQAGFAREIINLPGQPRSLQSNLTRKLIHAPGKPYWVATSGGLFRWDLDKARPENAFTGYYHLPENTRTLPSNEIIDGCYDEQGRLWVLTREVLSRFENNGFIPFIPDRDFTGPFYDLEPLPGDWLALGTQGGVQLFNTRTGQFTFLSFSKVGFKPGEPVRVKALKNGKTGLFSANTWVEFFPDSMGIQVPPPSLYLAGMWVKGLFRKEALGQGAVRLSHDEQPVVVRLGAMGLHQSDNFRIEYQVKGLDVSWKPLPADAEITYFQVPAGTYPLLARWKDASGRVGVPVRLCTWVVRPPFWTTWWFVLTVVTVLSAGVYGLYQFRLQQMIRTQSVRMRIAGDLHDEVGSALSSIAIGSELASFSLNQDPQRTALLIDRMRKTAMQTLDDMGDIIWAIHPKNDPGDSLLAKMKRVLADLLESRGIAVAFESDPQVDTLQLTMEARKNLFLIFKESVHNIAKHADCQHVHVHLHIQHHQLTMEVTDDGKGFSSPNGNGSGHGMESMRRRAHDLGALLEVKGVPGKGVDLRLSVAIPKVRKRK